MEKNYPQSAQSQKIHFWRRRWFWGIILGATGVWSFKTFFDIHYGTPLFSIFTRGILFFLYRFPMGIAMFFLRTINPAYNPYNFFVIIYYLVISFLLYQTLKNKKVKIKYPIILLIIILLTRSGLLLAEAFSNF